MEKEKTKEGMSPARLMALADGIFAFSMTLLVISINLPPIEADFNVG